MLDLSLMIFVVLILLGLCFGSFVNALVWRVHEQETGKLTKKQRKELSMLHGRSMCPHCRHALAWNDLLPLVSWISLRGKCRYCHKPIDDTPLAELLMPILFAVSYLAWPYGVEAAGTILFGLWLVFIIGFMALTISDLRWMLLPNKIIYPLVGLAIAQACFRAIVFEDAGLLLGALWGFLAIGGLFYVLFQVSGGKWIGGGDVKLGFVIGPLVGGPLNAILVIFIASVMGTLVSIPLLANKSLKATSRIPFGPFLIVATAAVYLYGERLADWYSNVFINLQ